MITETWTERIACYMCKHEFDAEVTHDHNEPWPVYVAECPKCGWWNSESEWNVVEGEK